MEKLLFVPYRLGWACPWVHLSLLRSEYSTSGAHAGLYNILIDPFSHPFCLRFCVRSLHLRCAVTRQARIDSVTTAVCAAQVRCQGRILQARAKALANIRASCAESLDQLKLT